MIFADLHLASADPILGLTEAFNNDIRDNKVNLGVGIYKDEAGNTPILESVKRAEAIILHTEISKNYLGITGIESYNQAVLSLLFGQDSLIISQSRAIAAQAPGGTGALRVAAEFLMANTQSNTIWLSNPTWANHNNIFAATGFTVKQYGYGQSDIHSLNFEAMIADLKQAKQGDIILLHGCCHNPTGIDPSLEQWQQVGELCCERGLVPLFDFAYQGFGSSIEKDAQGLRLVASMVPEMLVASSFSKNFGLYNERVGAVTLVATNQEQAVRAFSQIKRSIRSAYSNPPAHGALIVSTIMNTPELYEQWQSELNEMRLRIAEMRCLFVESLKSEGVKQDFDFIANQNGMFSFSGLTKAQVTRLKEEFAIYIVDSGRISVAGMTKSNIPVICKAIKAVL